MSSLLIVLAASGLATSQPAPANRAAQAMPAALTAMVQADPTKLPVGCFVPVQNGRLARVATVKKIKANCANPALSQGEAAISSSVATNLAASVAISAAVAVVTNEALKPSNQACVNGGAVSPC
jgi:hypothetical protein